LNVGRREKDTSRTRVIFDRASQRERLRFGPAALQRSALQRFSASTSGTGQPHARGFAMPLATMPSITRSPLDPLATKPPPRKVEHRIAKLDWTRIGSDLDARGHARTGPVLTETECAALRALYDDEGRFRSRIVMARHGFGRGEYQYFARPLPELVTRLRASAYAPLARIANSWAERLTQQRRFPETLKELHAECHAAGQERPTPLLLRYGPDDYNCLHQDLYGEITFPLQLAVLLSEPGEDFTGGELVLTEQRPRMQSRVEVVPLRRGEGVIFAVHQRPVAGIRGTYRVNMRHGVSRVLDGKRFTLGIIFHDAT
jgi:hypothetical protein